VSWFLKGTLNFELAALPSYKDFFAVSYGSASLFLFQLVSSFKKCLFGLETAFLWFTQRILQFSPIIDLLLRQKNLHHFIFAITSLKLFILNNNFCTHIPIHLEQNDISNQSLFEVVFIMLCEIHYAQGRH